MGIVAKKKVRLYSMKRNRKKGIALNIILISMCMIGVTAFVIYNDNQHKNDSTKEAITNVDKATKIEDIQTNINKKVEKEKYNIDINTSPICKQNICTVNFKNPPNNIYNSKLTIKDADNIIYQSEYIAPDYELKTITLQKDMRKGISDVTGIISILVDGEERIVNVEMKLDNQ